LSDIGEVSYMVPLDPKGVICSLKERGVRASPAVLSMWSYTVKIDEENPTYAGLTENNGFGSAELLKLPWLVKGFSSDVHLQKRVY
jgi:hypothetical protein